MTIAELLLSWLDRGKFASANNRQITQEGDAIKVRLWTATNVYAIVARGPHPARPPGSDTGYLGCVVSARAPIPGEDHTRGMDLADGPLNEETWNRILSDILTFELEDVYKPKMAPSVG